MKKHNIRLLIVEEDKTVRECLRKLTAKMVTQVILADNGEQAYRYYLNKKPDIVLTDFEIISRQGTNFIQQIRRHEKKTRIIVISAKADPQFFIKSIEHGVKGFLLKPIDDKQLELLLIEQVKDILLEKDFESGELKRHEAERERDKSEQILKTLSQATALFFRYGVSPANIHKILKLIGKATDSSRVNIFRNFEVDGEKFTGLAYSWFSEKKYDLSDKEYLKKIPNIDSSSIRWAKTMKKGKNILGNVRDFSGIERKTLEDNGVKSILSIPISVDGSWWGFISLDACKEVKSWSPAEVRAMETVAFNLGAAIYRFRVEREMIRITESLENRVRERTAELENEVVERMMAEELLKDSEEKYRMIYENATDGILLIQHDKIVLTSPSMVEIMERMPRFLIGYPFCEFVVPEQKEEVIQFFSDINSKKNNSLNVEVLVPDKANKWLELKTTKIDWDNQPAYLVFATEITLRVKAERELNRLNKGLEKRIKKEVKQVKEQQQLLVQKSKLESLGELSAGLAHEINQPLLGLSMGLDNILLATQEDSFSRSYVKKKAEVLFKDIDRIKQIVEHVRTFSREQQNVLNERIEINNMIRNTLLLANKMFEAKHIEFNVQLADDEIFVMGNPYRLEQVILNLLSNARHAVDEKDKQAESKEQVKEISLKVSREDETALIIVTDNGIGIPKKVIPKIFDPFFTTKNEEKGTGLGLSISYGIVKEMNGAIRVESTKMKNTKVTIELPVNN
ncbi:MAG: ATP-binding protein [Bacteroidales bacterium]|nr:ATP-binding protein [Bacteroidales bacterium]